MKYQDRIPAQEDVTLTGSTTVGFASAPAPYRYLSTSSHLNTDWYTIIQYRHMHL